MILGYILRLPNNPSLVLVIITKKIALHRCKAIFFMVGRAVNFAKAVLTYTALPLLNFFKAFLKFSDGRAVFSINISLAVINIFIHSGRGIMPVLNESENQKTLLLC